VTWLGLDIGGANLKAADGRGWARVQPFELWRDPSALSAALHHLLLASPAVDKLAITMTGELCDCFRTKAEGVRQILCAAEQIAGSREIRVYLVGGRLASISESQELWHLAAASNWHALAQFACRFVLRRSGILIDIGSTTTDIIPLVDGRPSPQGCNDTDRLIAGELAYTGVGRTPVCAVTTSLPWRNNLCPVAAEFFATAADAYVILSQLPEREDFTGTADGRPLTKQLSCERLARMICADASSFGVSDAERAAASIRDAQSRQLKVAIQKVVAQMKCQPDTLVLSGSGEFLSLPIAQTVFPDAAVVTLSEKLGPAVSAAGPAHALAVLANEGSKASSGSSGHDKA
jgi:probable H4MPT-linked C1 transfer pathway protein